MISIDLLFMGAGEKQADDQGWLVEQRYRAVLEVLDGSPVSEVAVRYGVSRQSVYAWKARHAAAGRHAWLVRTRTPVAVAASAAATAASAGLAPASDDPHVSRARARLTFSS